MKRNKNSNRFLYQFLCPSLVKENEHIKNFHAIYLEPHTKNIYCDLVVDYKLKDWDDLKKKFIDYMKKFYPDNNIILTIETEFV